ASRSELTSEELAHRDEQRQWMLDYINGLTEDEHFTRDAAVTKLNKVITDPLDPFFAATLTDTEFATFQKNVKESHTADQIAFGDTTIYYALIKTKLDALLTQWPVKNAGAGGANLLWYLEMKQRMMDYASLEEVNTHATVGSIFIERDAELSQPAPPNPKE